MAEGFEQQPTQPFLRRAREAIGSEAENASAPQSVGGDPGADRSTRGSELTRSVTDAAERIQEIIDAAERVASEIRHEAETEAATYLTERRREADAIAAAKAQRLKQVLDALRSQLARFEEEGRTMLRALEEEIERGGVSTAPGRGAEPPLIQPEAERRDEPEPAPASFEPAPAAPEPPPPAPVSPAPVAYPGTAAATPAPAEAPAPEADDRGVREAALIRATQMAIGGSQRAEIEAALRSEFAVEDPRPIVDEILGAG